jgi:cysteine synthase
MKTGPSTEANLTVALRLAPRLRAEASVVTTRVDSAMKYLADDLYSSA